MDIKGFFDNLSETIDENASAINLGIGIVSFGLAVVAACVEAPKIKDNIDRTKNELIEVTEAYDEGVMDDEEFKQVKKTLYFNCGKTLVRHGVPILLLAASGTYCTINAYTMENNKVASLTTALQISETSKKLYKEKVIEKFGEKKEREVVDEVNKEKLKRANKPDDKKIPVLETSKPATLCFDPYSGRYFRCSVDRLESAVNAINAEMLHNMCQTVNLNDLYDEIGIPLVKGETRGWNADNGTFRLRPTSAMNAENEPTLVMDFDIEPTYAAICY